jgi:uncharacterized repeat protein (TIGR03803 family)
LKYVVLAVLATGIYSTSIEWALAEHNESVIHSFVYATGNDPAGGPSIDPATGIFYGVTSYGGANGTGTVYQVSPPDATHHRYRYSVIYDFAPGVKAVTEGLLAVSGSVYVVINQNGGAGCNKLGCGEVLGLTQPTQGKWTVTILHQFTGGSDGSFPTSSVVMDSHGRLYGVAENGGTGCEKPGGCGVLYKLTPPDTEGQPWSFSVAYNFIGGDNTAFPGGLNIDKEDNLYGSASFSEDTYKQVIYKLAPSGGGWTETILYRFYVSPKQCGGAAAPSAIDATGALYGIGKNPNCNFTLSNWVRLHPTPPSGSRR